MIEYLEIALKLVPNLGPIIIPLLYEDNGKRKKDISLSRQDLAGEFLFPSKIAKMYGRNLSVLENPPDTASQIQEILALKKISAEIEDEEKF